MRVLKVMKNLAASWNFNSNVVSIHKFGVLLRFVESLFSHHFVNVYLIGFLLKLFSFRLSFYRHHFLTSPTVMQWTNGPGFCLPKEWHVYLLAWKKPKTWRPSIEQVDKKFIDFEYLVYLFTSYPKLIYVSTEFLKQPY